jgi:hypothetical protein
MLEDNGYLVECTKRNKNGEERVIVARRIKWER